MSVFAKDESLDFETWARLLIFRKVPDDYRHLINPKVVHRGAVILEHGDAFEVRVCDYRAHQKILVTPFPTTLHTRDQSRSPERKFVLLR